MEIILETAMLVCFGLAWPFSTYRSYKSGSNIGKSIGYLIIALMGYLCGIAYKILVLPNIVLWLYLLNAGMVALDIAIYVRNGKRNHR